MSNKCDHDVKNLKKYVSTHKGKPKPYLFEEFKKKTVEMFYYSKSSLNRELSRILISLRRRRSELRETAQLIMSFIADHMNKDLKLDFFFEKTMFKKLGVSKSRGSAAIKLLKKAGYIIVKCIKKYQDGAYRTIKTEFTITPKYCLDIGIQWSHIEEFRSFREKKPTLKEQKKMRSNTNLMAEMIKSKLGSKISVFSKRKNNDPFLNDRLCSASIIQNTLKNSEKKHILSQGSNKERNLQQKIYKNAMNVYTKSCMELSRLGIGIEEIRIKLGPPPRAPGIT